MPSDSSTEHPTRRRTAVKWGWCLTAYLILATVFFIGCSQSDTKKSDDPFPQTMRPERHQKADPARCAQCHEKQHQDWLASHHAHANRPIDMAKDSGAFHAPVAEGELETTEPYVSDSSLQMPAPDRKGESVKAEGVLGYHPLRQYLVPSEGGRWQAHSLSYDPDTGEWFDMFGTEERVPGEWGHWSGQGMNWNSNCAWCHMTEFDANYDILADTYHSEWTSQSVSCLQCHSQAIEHADAAELGKAYVSANPYETPNRELAMQNCATCHSRRDQLTAGEFVAGDFYHDHYGLTLPEAAGIYFPDFKAQEEDYVYASLQLSNMGHAGVTCFDCHNPHSGDFVAPKENNMLCIQCHSTGNLNAPIINPTLHSKHAAGSPGNSCIECHMPTRTYMARDPRHDHGFTIPDPVLTRELGVPNACSQCHDDKDLDWAIEAFENDFRTPEVEARREHAHMMAQAWDPNQEFPLEKLVETYAQTENPYRLATYLRIMANAGLGPNALPADANPLEHKHSIVRAAATGLYANDPDQALRLEPLLDDPIRDVRLDVTQALLRSDPTRGIDLKELDAYLAANSDRPQMRIQLAQQASLAGNSELAFQHAQTAISFDKNNSAVYYQSAIALAGGGNLEGAHLLLRSAPDLARQDGWVDFGEGLLWAERQNLTRAIESLERAVAKDPDQERWWYNLITSYLQAGNQRKAASLLQQGLGRFPDSESLNSLVQYFGRPQP